MEYAWFYGIPLKLRTSQHNGFIFTHPSENRKQQQAISKIYVTRLNHFQRNT